MRFSVKFSALVMALLLAGCHAGVNKSFRVADGQKVDSGFTSVNGSIRIGGEAEVRGSSQTVNGRISVDDGSRVGGLSTVNGSIEIGGRVTVDGDMESVNGSLECGSGSEVDGDLSTINGKIRLDGTTVAGRLKTYNGDVILRHGSRVKRDVVIERNRGSGHRRGLDIRIEDGSVVEGDVIVKSKRPVTVYLSGGGEVLGSIEGAEVVREPSDSGTQTG